MFKRSFVICMLFTMLAFVFAGAEPGRAQGEQPPKEIITSLYRVADIYPGATGSAPEDLVSFSGALFFGANGNDAAGRELWKYESNTGIAVRVADIYPGASSSFPYYLTVYENALYFQANGNDGTGSELWKYTIASGAQRVADICAGAASSWPGHLEIYNSVLYFNADGCDGAGQELWSYDTIHGAQRVVDIYGGASGSNPLYMTAYNNALYFAADGGDGADRELWRYDPTHGAQRVEDINSVGASFPGYLAVYNGALYFCASGDDGAGQELWMYDPTNGAQLVADIFPGVASSNPNHLAAYNGALYFSAYGHDGTGTELWKYDLVNGANRLADINPGVAGSLPAYLAVYNGSLYFQANGNDGAGAELWQYGTTSTAAFRSVRSQDGWVLESAETTNVGGSVNASSVVFYLGDDAGDRQYRSVLSFNTSTLPDNAVVTGIVLAIRRQGLIIGTNPFTTHGYLRVDIRKGAFGTSALQAADFQSAASKNNVGIILDLPDANNWYLARLALTAYSCVNPVGATQLRLRFTLDDNDDRSADFLKFFSGDVVSVSSRPLLVVTYYVP
jgi:ELWxxDGT repeat protein